MPLALRRDRSRLHRPGHRRRASPARPATAAASGDDAEQRDEGGAAADVLGRSGHRFGSARFGGGNQAISGCRPSTVEASCTRFRRPATRRAATYHIAYQVVGNGPIDLVFVPGFVSNVEHGWEDPPSRSFYRAPGVVRAPDPVRQARHRHVGSRGAATAADARGAHGRRARGAWTPPGRSARRSVGVSRAVPMSLLFAATYPERTAALVLVGTFARIAWAPDYPLGARAGRVGRAAGADGRAAGARASCSAPSRSRSPRIRRRVEWWARFQRAGVQSRGGGGADAHGLRDRRAHDPAGDPRADAGPPPQRGSPGAASSTPRYLAAPHPGRQVRRAARRRTTCFFAGDADADPRRDRGVPHRRAPRRASPTASSRPSCSPTSSARPSGPRSSATRAGATLLDAPRRACARRQLERFRGREVDTAGDGFFATFDGPARAIRCAAGDPRSASAPLGLEVRAGLHTGECEVIGDEGRRHRRPHRRARRGAGRRRRGARVEHGQGPGRRLGDRRSPTAARMR